MSKIVIRRAGQGDAALIADLSRQTFYETFAAVNTAENMDIFMKGPFQRDRLMKEAGEADAIFLLAYDGDLPAGYLMMREGKKYPEFENSASAEIVRIYALQSMIGKGVGKALLENCIALALEMKKEILWLGVWEHNQKAIGFYQKWGFEKFGEHEFMLGKDIQTDWLMKKKIA